MKGISIVPLSIKIELISIGDELLKGAVVNTNAASLRRHLLQNGYSVARQTTDR